ncbi:Fic family protein [Legionella bononiensis]|uniref:Fic family protein n=1 Tax=Legionella bononiensis TaxID=2793102 RepID=UPI0019337F5A|nr:Fic family protein [Legionella bononiensis]MBL7480583.1 Fic family protein [Legionella bononiensis]
MPSFLNLKLFNPALVYSFEPESSPEALIYGEGLNEALYKMEQYEDMQAAYIYAEEIILPWIQANGLAALTPEIFEDWILNIHKRMGKTVLSLSEEGKSGEYSKMMVIRWHFGSNMMNHLAIYFAKLFNPQLSESEFLNMLVNENQGLDYNDAKQFLHILQRLEKDNTAPIHSTLKEIMKLQEPFVGFTLALNRLTTAVHDNLLPKHERDVVEKIALFVDYPERLPGQMRNFAETMVPLWKQLNNNDLVAVSEFCAELFYQFTHIHAFPNANGRTATELNNIVLRSINLPDILMRKPGDRNANTGSYAEAIASIEKDRRPLAAHILKCIIEAQTKPFADPALAKLIDTRMVMHKIALQIKAIKPDFDLNRITEFVVDKNPALQFLDHSNNAHSLIACQLLIATAQEVLTALTKEAERKKIATTSVSLVSFLKPAFDRNALQNQMEEITGFKDWKITNKESLSIWRYCASEAEATEIVNGLNQLNFCEANVRTTAEKGKKIVLCSNINLEQLQSAIPSQAPSCH